MSNFYILSKNYIDVESTINVSSNPDDNYLLFDQSRDIQWKSLEETGENGTYPTYIEILFYSGGIAVNRTIDTLVLQNINLKKFKIQYWNGMAYVDIPNCDYTVNILTNLRIKLGTAIVTPKIKIIMDATIIANEEKKIGEIWAMLESMNCEFRSSREYNINGINGNFRSAGGILHTFFVYGKMELLWDLSFITTTVLAQLKAIYNAHAIITIYIDYEIDPNSIFLGQWVGNWKYLQSEPRVPYYTVTFEFKEN